MHFLFFFFFTLFVSRENSSNTQKTPDSGHVSQDPKSDNSSNQSSPEVLMTTKNRCVLKATGLVVLECLTQGVALISAAGLHPSLKVRTSPAPPPTTAAWPAWWRRMRRRPQRIMTQAWWAHSPSPGLILNAGRGVRVSLLCALSRRVCRLPGRHTSEIPSPTARGWRTAAAAPVPPVVVTPRVRQMWRLEASFLLQGVHQHLPTGFTHP